MIYHRAAASALLFNRASLMVSAAVYGHLEVTILDVENIVSSDVFSTSSDVFVTALVGTREICRTEAITSANYINFNHKCPYNTVTAGSHVELRIYDQDLVNDDLLDIFTTAPLDYSSSFTTYSATSSTTGMRISISARFRSSDYAGDDTCCGKWTSCELGGDRTWISQVQAQRPCPCALNSGLLTDPDHTPWTADDSIWDAIGHCPKAHPGATFCIRSKPVSTSGGVLAGDQCCYDSSLKLITSGAGAGSIDRFAPDSVGGILNHCSSDVLSFITCGSEAGAKFYSHARPASNPLGCPANPSSWYGTSVNSALATCDAGVGTGATALWLFLDEGSYCGFSSLASVTCTSAAGSDAQCKDRYFNPPPTRHPTPPSPRPTPAAQAGCQDEPLGWLDHAFGDGCGEYGYNFWCGDYGDDVGTGGKTALEACCACGGGSSYSPPTPQPNSGGTPPTTRQPTRQPTLGGYCVTGSGMEGTCEVTTSCAQGGKTSVPGYCPGPTSVQCCIDTAPTPPTPAPSRPSCVTGSGLSGSCSLVSACGAVPYPGYCPGDSSVQCCAATECQVTTGGGALPSGTCMPATICGDVGLDGITPLGTAYSGFCPGDASIQCCVPPPTLPPTFAVIMPIPTQQPSPLPTMRTHIPTSIPTRFPTRFPTVIPTNFPTNFPTHFPTNSPTRVPSSQPTTLPTQLPTARTLTLEPSVLPSVVPTAVQSSSSPTVPPTMSPTMTTPSPAPTTPSPTETPSTSPAPTTPSPTETPSTSPAPTTPSPTETPSTSPAPTTPSPTETPSTSRTPAPSAALDPVPSPLPPALWSEAPTNIGGGVISAAGGRAEIMAVDAGTQRSLMLAMAGAILLVLV